MPIDRRGRGESAAPGFVAAPAQQRELRTLRARVIGRRGDAHESAQREPRQAPRSPRASATASSGATPLFDASPLMFTCTSTSSGATLGARGPPTAARAIFNRSMLSIRSNSVGGQRRLVALERPDRAPSARSGEVGELVALRARFLDVVLAERAWPAACTSRIAADGNVLETASSVTSPRIASRRARGGGDAGPACLAAPSRSGP